MPAAPAAKIVIAEARLDLAANVQLDDLLATLGYTNVIFRLGALTLSDVADADVVCGDEFVWAIAKTALFRSCYDAGMKVFTTGNDTTNAHPAVTNWTSKDGSTLTMSPVTPAVHKASSGWVAEAQDTDTGQMPIALRAGALPIARASWASGAQTGIAAFAEVNPNGSKGRWAHVQQATGNRIFAGYRTMVGSIFDWLLEPPTGTPGASLSARGFQGGMTLKGSPDGSARIRTFEGG